MLGLRNKESYKTKTIRFESGERFILAVDCDGVPVDWPTVYCAVRLRGRGLMLSTMRKEMDAVCLLYDWCRTRDISLDERIDSLKLFDLAEMEALRAAMRLNLRGAGRRAGEKGNDNRNNRKEARPGKLISGNTAPVVANGHWRNRLTAVSDYLAWRYSDAMFRLDIRDPRRTEAREVLDNIHEWLVGDIQVFENDLLEGLDEDARDALVLAITPGHPTNPFISRNQIRNYALWLFYIDAGLRRSAPLGIKTKYLELGGRAPGVIIHRSADDPEDPRRQQPVHKTKAHRVELSARLHAALDEYVTGDRRTYPGAKSSPYLFFSQKGLPLSIGAVDTMYRLLREKVPDLPPDFSTHDSRRTWNDKLSEAAEEIELDPEIERQVRNQAMGWSRSSDQGSRYARRRNRKRASEIMLHMQDQLTNGGGE